MSCSNSPLFIQIYHHTYQAPLFNIFFFYFFFFPPDSLKLSHLLSYFFFFSFSEGSLRNWGSFCSWGVRAALEFPHQTPNGECQMGSNASEKQQPTDQTNE